MKLLRSLSLASCCLFLGTACERHPASQTLPEHEEKNHSDGEEKLIESTAHPRQFFHSSTNAAVQPTPTAAE